MIYQSSAQWFASRLTELDYLSKSIRKSYMVRNVLSYKGFLPIRKCLWLAFVQITFSNKTNTPTIMYFCASYCANNVAWAAAANTFCASAFIACARSKIASSSGVMFHPAAKKQGCFQTHHTRAWNEEHQWRAGHKAGRTTQTKPKTSPDALTARLKEAPVSFGWAGAAVADLNTPILRSVIVVICAC